MKTFDGSPRPNQMIASGIHASGGIGRNSSMIGRSTRPNAAIPARGDADDDAGHGADARSPRRCAQRLHAVLLGHVADGQALRRPRR